MAEFDSLVGLYDIPLTLGPSPPEVEALVAGGHNDVKCTSPLEDEECVLCHGTMDSVTIGGVGKQDTYGITCDERLSAGPGARRAGGARDPRWRWGPTHTNLAYTDAQSCDFTEVVNTDDPASKLCRRLLSLNPENMSRAIKRGLDGKLGEPMKQHMLVSRAGHELMSGNIDAAALKASLPTLGEP